MITFKSKLMIPLATFGLLAFSGSALATPLALEGVDSFIEYRVCANACAPDNSTCLDACPSPVPEWDKDKSTTLGNLHDEGFIDEGFIVEGFIDGGFIRF